MIEYDETIGLALYFPHNSIHSSSVWWLNEQSHHHRIKCLFDGGHTVSVVPTTWNEWTSDELQLAVLIIASPAES